MDIKDKTTTYIGVSEPSRASWRYVDESHDKFGWPNYGRILKQKTETWIEGYRKWKKKMSQ